MKTFILYDEKIINRDGTRVLLNGLKLEAFKKNPVMLYMHSRGTDNKSPSGSEVIGRWENIRLQGAQLLADAVFDEQDEFSKRIAQKVKENFLRAASIGIEVIASSEEEKYKIEGQTGSSIVSSILLEASVVDIPKNSNALTNQFFVQHGQSGSTDAHKQEAARHHNEMARSGGDKNIKTLSAEVATLRGSLEKITHWQANFLKRQRENMLDYAIETGVIDDEQRAYYNTLLKKDFELGQKLITLQYKKWKKTFVSNTPNDLHHFMIGIKGADGISRNEKRNSYKKVIIEKKAGSEYEFMLKNSAKELKELKERAPDKFKELLEKHLIWREKKSTDYST